MSPPEPTDDAPNFARLLAPFIGRVPPASVPRFLARLERGAADRYRAWAAALPDHAELLLECAASEEQIAIRAEAIFPVIAEDLASIEEALPGARDTYFDAFEGVPIQRQLAMQAAAERQGAQAWQALERDDMPDGTRAELDALTALEIESAERLESLLAKLAG